nr:mannose-P-dolichol utilization defect 1 protein homolog 2-like [Tanacetum cinerariifolium]
LYLRHYVSAKQHDWANLFDVAQFSYNMQHSEATGKSPFELVTGRQPLTPNALAALYEGSSPAAYKTVKEWHEQADMARASLDKETKRMKKWADERRRHVEFEPGFWIVLHLTRRLSGILWKVEEGLGSPWNVLESVGRLGRRVSGNLWKVDEGLGSPWNVLECIRKCWKARKVIEALRSSRSLPEEYRIVHST